MAQLLFVVAFVLLGAGSYVGGKIADGSIIDQPRNPGPLRLLSGIGILAAWAFFVWGFFPFSWWLPLLALVPFAFVRALFNVHVQHRSGAPLFCMTSIVLGFVAAASTIAVSA